MSTSKYTPAQLSAWARQALQARDSSNVTDFVLWQALLQRLAARTGLDTMQCERRIELLAIGVPA